MAIRDLSDTYPPGFVLRECTRAEDRAIVAYVRSRRIASWIAPLVARADAAARLDYFLAQSSR